MSFVDVVVVGSGFGGAVVAARLGEYARDALGGARRILVVERGEDPTGRFDARSTGGALNSEGNRFKHSLAPDYVARFAERTTDTTAVGAPSMNVVSGRGLGGGSNVYCGVSLRAPEVSFSQASEHADDRGRRLWPAIYSRAALDRHYARVESMLRVHKLEWTDRDVPHWQLTTKRDLVFAEGCRRIGAAAAPLKVAVDRDTNEGWWTQGQRYEGRQSLTKNYLDVAHRAGVELRTGCTVDRIEPLVGGGYVVHGEDVRGGVARPFEIECTMLVIAAGSLGSTSLLLRSDELFTGDRRLDRGRDVGAPHLGRHVSGNGDYGVTGVVGEDFALAVEGFKGKPMSSFCPTFWPEHRFIIIPFYAEPLYFALGQISSLVPANDANAVGRRSTVPMRTADGRVEREWGPSYKVRLESFGARMLTMGCLALDDGEGEINLDELGRTAVKWQETSPRTEARWGAAFRVMRSIYEALGGEVALDSYRGSGTVNTAHPLGGARMASAPRDGIVDANGEVFGNPNLFVVDGAVVPSALGVNPSLTIAAIAESICDRLLHGTGTDSFSDRLSRQS